jgi:hypothetical protein
MLRPANTADTVAYIPFAKLKYIGLKGSKRSGDNIQASRGGGGSGKGWT